MEEEWADDEGALIPGIDVKLRLEPPPVANGNDQMDQVCDFFLLWLHYPNLISFIHISCMQKTLLKYSLS